MTERRGEHGVKYRSAARRDLPARWLDRKTPPLLRTGVKVGRDCAIGFLGAEKGRLFLLSLLYQVAHRFLSQNRLVTPPALFQ